jgi:hypothetical protein
MIDHLCGVFLAKIDPERESWGERKKKPKYGISQMGEQRRITPSLTLLANPGPNFAVQ